MDLINKQDVIDAVTKYCTKYDLRELLADIEVLSSVEQAQKTGKWIKLDMHIGMADHKCTACNGECYVPTIMGEPIYAFCPNCGSRMEREEDEHIQSDGKANVLC